jgi:hypothetical protein
MRFLLVLLCLAAPANAVTFHLTGAKLDTCTSYVWIGNEPDPTPCIGKSMSFDGTVRVKNRLVRDLTDTWVFSELADPSLFQNAQVVGLKALKVRLGFKWRGERNFGLHFNQSGDLDQWWLTSAQIGGTRWFEAASYGSHALTDTYALDGSAGTMTRARTAVAGPIPATAPVPLPAAVWLLLAGLALLAYAGRPLTAFHEPV